MATDSTPDTQNADNGKDAESLGTQSTLESAGPCKQRIKAEIPSDKVVEQLDRNYQELINTVQIRGFRRGRVPRQLIEKRYGDEIQKDVKESLLTSSFEEVVKEKELKILGKPKFDNVNFKVGEPLSYEVEVEVQPEFELGTYKGVEVEAEEVAAVTEKEIDEQLEAARQRFAELAPVDPDEAGADDVFLGHYALIRDGHQVYTQKDVRFQPSRGGLDEFEIPDLMEKIKSRGKSPTFSTTLTPSDQFSQENLRGKEVELKFTIVETKRVQVPEVNDEFAKRFDAADPAALRSRFKKELEERHKEEHRTKLEAKVLEQVTREVQLDLPEGLMEAQINQSRMKLQLALAQQGKSREEIDEALKKIDDKAASDEIREDFKRYFVLEKIAEQEKIFATEDEVMMRVALLARAYGKPFQEVQEEMENSNRMESVRAEVRHSKAKEFLREKAKVTTVAPSSKESASRVKSPDGTKGKTGPEKTKTTSKSADNIPADKKSADKESAVGESAMKAGDSGGKTTETGAKS